eukprot:4846741-Prorocentrum_lima.AAC.1
MNTLQYLQRWSLVNMPHRENLKKREETSEEVQYILERRQEAVNDGNFEDIKTLTMGLRRQRRTDKRTQTLWSIRHELD